MRCKSSLRFSRSAAELDVNASSLIAKPLSENRRSEVSSRRAAAIDLSAAPVRQLQVSQTIDRVLIAAQSDRLRLCSDVQAGRIAPRP